MLYGFDKSVSLDAYVSGRKGFAFPTSQLQSQGHSYTHSGGFQLNIFNDGTTRELFGYRGQKGFEWPKDYVWHVEVEKLEDGYLPYRGTVNREGHTQEVWLPEKGWVTNVNYDHSIPFFERYDRETLLRVLSAFDGGAGPVLPHALARNQSQGTGPFRGI